MNTKPKAVTTIAALPAPRAPAALLTAPSPRSTGHGVETVEHHAETATTTATATLTAGVEQVQGKVKQGVESAMKTAEQFAHFHQGNIEAMMKSGQIWTAGLQDLSKHVASNARASMEETISTFRAMSGVKSIKEAMALQSSFAKASMEKAMAESTRLTETGLKLAEQAYAPLTARMNAAVEVFTNRA
jgi:phasin family protein